MPCEGKTEAAHEILPMPIIPPCCSWMIGLFTLHETLRGDAYFLRGGEQGDPEGRGIFTLLARRKGQEEEAEIML